jgi:hypothetical protein
MVLTLRCVRVVLMQNVCQQCFVQNLHISCHYIRFQFPYRTAYPEKRLLVFVRLFRTLLTYYPEIGRFV